jgi:acyl CoA:acetate/3-ketoacid CoA transferase beta subunit
MKQSAEKGKANVAQKIDDAQQSVARKINDSLKDGETGILFIGMAHDVASLLPEDIEVEIPGL